MRDSKDPKLKFLWDRMVVSTRPDPSDAGMTYFLVSGDEYADPDKLKQLIRDHSVPTPITERSTVRLESEHFVTLDGYEVVIHKRKITSHGLIVKSTGSGGQISSPFFEPHANASAHCDVEVRYLDEANQRPEFGLAINGVIQGAKWKFSGSGTGWMSHTISSVAVKSGDNISVKSSGGSAQLDFVELSNIQTVAAAAEARPDSGTIVATSD